MCAWHPVRPNKSRHQSLEQRKVYCKAKQGDQVIHTKKSETLQWFSEKSLYRQNLGWGLQRMFWLIGGEVTGKSSRNLVVCIKLNILHVGGSLSSCRRTQHATYFLRRNQDCISRHHYPFLTAPPLFLYPMIGNFESALWNSGKVKKAKSLFLIIK